MCNIAVNEDLRPSRFGLDFLLPLSGRESSLFFFFISIILSSIFWHPDHLESSLFDPVFDWKENSPVSFSTSLGAVTSSPTTSDRGSLPGTSGSPIDGLRALRPSPVRIKRVPPSIYLLASNLLHVRPIPVSPPPHPPKIIWFDRLLSS